jgi:hypothetical protein
MVTSPAAKLPALTRFQLYSRLKRYNIDVACEESAPRSPGALPHASATFALDYSAHDISSAIGPGYV